MDYYCISKEKFNLQKDIKNLRKRLNDKEQSLTDIIDRSYKLIEENSKLKNENDKLKAQNNILKEDNAKLKEDNDKYIHLEEDRLKQLTEQQLQICKLNKIITEDQDETVMNMIESLTEELGEKEDKIIKLEQRINDISEKFKNDLQKRKKNSYHHKCNVKPVFDYD